MFKLPGYFAAGLVLYALYAPAPLVVTALLVRRSAAGRPLASRNPAPLVVLGALGGATWPIAEILRGAIDISSSGWFPVRAYGIGLILGASSTYFAWLRSRQDAEARATADPLAARGAAT